MSTVTHPYFPLAHVRFAELRSEKGDRVEREVLRETKLIAGVSCTVLDERDFRGTTLEEVTHNYFAQDADGNVYYFGEDVDEYENGRVSGHGGAWLVGKEVAEPCLFLPAQPRVGMEFKPEDAPPDAEEFNRIESLEGTITLPAGSFRALLVVQEGDQRGAWKESKYYAKGVGLISENGTLNLVKYELAAGTASTR